MSPADTRVVLLVGLGLFFGCGKSAPKERREREAEPAIPDAAPLDARAPDPVVLPFPTVPSEKGALLAVGALPIWRLVVQRGDTLARRGQEGVAVGRVRAVDGELWLSDESEGAGALATRLLIPEGMVLPAETRVVAWGSWVSPETGVWAWQARQVASLPGTGAPLPELPGLEVRRVKARGLTPLSELLLNPKAVPAKVAFYVRRGPSKPGDPWIVTDSAKGAGLAELYLPGADGSYGGQDYRSTAEYWKLRRRRLYWVRAVRVRPPSREGELPSIRAGTAPYLLDRK